MTILGIDPGASGGIALVPHKFSSSGPIALKMPATERDIWDAVKDAAAYADAAWIEKVSAMPKQGVSSTFKFGRSYGFLRACLFAAGIPIHDVAPGVWQRALGCLSGGDKNITKAKAQELFPMLERITHATADALLIAEYGRRMTC